jgi:hypothetical protein
MSDIVKDTVVSVGLGLGLGIVVIGGISYIMPSFSTVSGWIPSEDTVISYGVSAGAFPVKVAGGIGSSLGAEIMKAAGWTYTAEELKQKQIELIGQKDVPGTPAYAAQRFHNVLKVPNQLKQLADLRIEILGSNDMEWNKKVHEVYFPMYLMKLNDSIELYTLNI